jgi:hypothetical protein
LEIYWQFGIFTSFWFIVSRKIWQPCLELTRAFVNEQSGDFFLSAKKSQVRVKTAVHVQHGILPIHFSIVEGLASRQ